MTDDGYCHCRWPMSWRLCRSLGLHLHLVDYIVEPRAPVWVSVLFDHCPWCRGWIRHQGYLTSNLRLELTPSS